jgi:UDP-N-acetylglucosamine 2-epimerase (non-hydrolysing)
MPEEINRIVTDCVSDLLFTTEDSGNQNLRREGVPEEKIHFVGNTMIDSLVHCSRLFDQIPKNGRLSALNGSSYFLATIHRPSNVDDPKQVMRILDILESASQLAPLFFVAHPRTRERLQGINAKHSLMDVDETVQNFQRGFIYLLPALAYLDFLRLMSKSRAVLTDSGGIQEETTFLGIPCFTLRNNTERPITVELGTNEVVGLDRSKILSCLCQVMENNGKTASIPPFWDGRAADRVVQVLSERFGFSRPRPAVI